MPHRVRSSTFGVRGRPSGRLTEWFGSAQITSVSTLAANSIVLDQSLTALEMAKRPFTITRTVGVLWVKSDQQAGQEEPIAAVGGMVVSSKAVSVGVTAVPTPLTNKDDDGWFLYQFGVAEGGTLTGQPFYTYPFDSRAQRKVVDGEDIAITLENSNAAHAMEYILQFRMLVKLS